MKNDELMGEIADIGGDLSDGGGGGPKAERPY